MASSECSFCGKQQDEVKRLVAGPGVYICDECVALCQAVIDESATAEAGPEEQDASAQSLDARIARALADDALLEHLGKLAYRERRVLELRYGLMGEAPRTLDSVARRFGLTRHETRAIETKSLATLRSAAKRPPD